MTPTTGQQIGRNEKCPCGSGRKYKQCCLGKDEEKARQVREKAAAQAAREAEKERKAEEKAREAAAKKGQKLEEKEAAPAAPTRTPKPQTHQPWKKSAATNTHAFQRMTTPRKVGGS